MRTWISGILLLAVLVAPAAGQYRDVANEDVDRAIAEASRYLWAQQQENGHWPWHGHYQVPRGGTTAIALFALLEAGEHPNDDRIKKGLEALVALETDNLYVRSVRAMVLSQVVAAVKNSPYRKNLKDDVRWLKAGAASAGAWGYGGAERKGENSCSQFGLLALWEASRAGEEIKAALIRRVEQTWLKRQQADGGWSYSVVQVESLSTMTSAALASLFICQDILTTGAPARQQEKALVGAWRYLAKNLDANYIDNGYLAFCVQRVGMASGRKFIGDMDWFAAGAAELAKPQPRGRSWRGNWGSIVRASFELIFLARGRLPLTFNKLQYGTEEQWNFHNRDVPRFTEYMRRNFELRMRWQVINITGDVREMLDTPILLVAGQQAPDFTPEQWAKLREYTLRGGTLLFVPTKRNFAFINAVKKALKNLYDEQRSLAGDYYSLQKLPGDHPIYVSKNHAKIPSGQTAAPLWGVSDGTRLLAVLCERDIAKAWQRRAVAKGRIDYDLGVNFYFYATGENRMRMRMRPVFIDRGGVVRKTIKVAWLKHDGNWCSQPYALSYLSQKLIAQNRVKIDLKAGVPIEAGKLRDYHLAWMTGSKEFKLSKEQLAGLQAFIGAGGTLFINAIGGSTDFNDSVRRMLRDLFEGQDYFSSQVGALSSLVTGKFGEEFRGPRLEKLRRTIAWRRVAQDPGSVALTIYLQNDRIVAIHAPYGIHDTLDGHTAHDAKCYMPDSARNIAGNIALYALMEKPKPKPKPKKPAETKSATAPAAK